jgi:predicted GH43/DUF377 family glycosyl hydrolase
VDGLFYMLYRAEAGDGCTGRIGLAWSEDGLHFTRHSEPVIAPEHDYEERGCEDPRIVRFGDTYWLTYVGNGGAGPGNICLASSKDLFHWEKHGSILQPAKDWDSRQVKAGAILPEKVRGKYVMYFMGEARPWETAIGLAYSDDLLHWHEPLDGPVLLPRQGYFDSKGVEPGPPPLMLDEGILLVYCGWGEDRTYRPGWVLFSKEEPERVLARSEEPILEPAKNWGEQFGLTNHVVAESLLRHEGRWWLYYGAADKAVCLAFGRRVSSNIGQRLGM